MNFNAPVLARADSAIDFNWSVGSPAASVNVDQFSARWRGKLQAKYS
ncbi:MAG: PA14 domain-containing protein, partial [Pseudomonadota bacterium]